MKSCLKCLHHNVCKIYHGEMARGEYRGKDFIKALGRLQTKLGGACKEYLGDNDEPPSKNSKSSFKLHLPSRWSLHSPCSGDWGNTQSHYPFRSLVHICGGRRDHILATTQEK